MVAGNFLQCGDAGLHLQCCTADFLSNTAETRALAAFTTALQQQLSDSRQEYQEFLGRLFFCKFYKSEIDVFFYKYT